MSNKTLLTALISANPGMKPEDVLVIFEKLLLGEARIQRSVMLSANSEESSEASTGESQPAAAQHGLTRDDLKVDPATAIQEDSITCCVCGKQFSGMLTKAHLALHGLTHSGYLELCGYGPGTKLASHGLIREKRERIKEFRPWEARRKAKTPVDDGPQATRKKSAPQQVVALKDTTPVESKQALSS